MAFKKNKSLINNKHLLILTGCFARLHPRCVTFGSCYLNFSTALLSASFSTEWSCYFSNNQQKSELKTLQNKMIWLKAMKSLLTHVQADSKPHREEERCHLNRITVEFYRKLWIYCTVEILNWRRYWLKLYNNNNIKSLALHYSNYDVILTKKSQWNIFLFE